MAHRPHAIQSSEWGGGSVTRAARPSYVCVYNNRDIETAPTWQPHAATHSGRQDPSAPPAVPSAPPLAAVAPPAAAAPTMPAGAPAGPPPTTPPPLPPPTLMPAPTPMPPRSMAMTPAAGATAAAPGAPVPPAAAASRSFLAAAAVRALSCVTQGRRAGATPVQRVAKETEGKTTENEKDETGAMSARGTGEPIRIKQSKAVPTERGSVSAPPTTHSTSPHSTGYEPLSERAGCDRAYR